MPILVDRAAPHVTRLTLSNPGRRNALTQDMYRELGALWPRLAADRACRVVLVRGEGSEAFCTGSDLSGGPFTYPDAHDMVDAALLKTGYFPKPIVAAVEGDCVGGGLELLLSTDVRIAAPTSRFGLPEVRWGLMPWGGAAMKLADQVGQGPAMDLLLTGRLIDAREAKALGLISALSDDVQALALERAARIAEASPAAVQATKAAALQHRQAGYAAREPTERDLVTALRATGQSKIGIAAFLAKTTPEYPDE
ncbi:MAG: putative enoyl-CoA hydratase/isomerase [Caulobacter sp.]|nr:putative enoyl-CoA hydratase/isomerase [Caulobacter sp.]